MYVSASHGCVETLQVFILQLYLSLLPIFYFMLRQHRAYGLARFRHNIYLERVRRRSCFGSNCLVCLGDGPNSLLKYCISFLKQLGMFLRSPCKISSGVMLTNIETPQSLIENIQWFHTHFELWPLDWQPFHSVTICTTVPSNLLISHVIIHKSCHKHVIWMWCESYCRNVWQVQMCEYLQLKLYSGDWIAKSSN